MGLQSYREFFCFKFVEHLIYEVGLIEVNMIVWNVVWIYIICWYIGPCSCRRPTKGQGCLSAEAVRRGEPHLRRSEALHGNTSASQAGDYVVYLVYFQLSGSAPCPISSAGNYLQTRSPHFSAKWYLPRTVWYLWWILMTNEFHIHLAGPGSAATSWQCESSNLTTVPLHVDSASEKSWGARQFSDSEKRFPRVAEKDTEGLQQTTGPRGPSEMVCWRPLQPKWQPFGSENALMPWCLRFVNSMDAAVSHSWFCIG